MGQSISQQACSHCGTLNNIGDTYCANCGFALDSTITATALSTFNAPTLASSSGRRITGALGSGELLGSRYRVVQLIGKGGFGAVYQANDERFGGRRRVAIKEMSDAHLGAAERARAIANFRQEADILVQLNHSNLPDVSDFLEEGGKAYLIMEFVDGDMLEKIQENVRAPLDETLVMGWALQLCDVLHYLHTQPHPIIFRDLKPPNIMSTRTNQIKLIDFGIARVFKSASTKDTDTLGSQGYAPLEQYGRGQSDARTDIYALGATLYDLLTNTVPPPSPMRRVNPQGLVSPRQLNPRVSSGVEQIVLKAMQELPEQRYQSAAEMFQAISGLGFSLGRNTGGAPKVAGPNAPTIASTQPTSSLTSATIHPQSTQAAAFPQPPATVQQSLPGMQRGGQPAIAPPPQNTPAALASFTQQGTQMNQYAPLPITPGGPLQGSPQAPVTPNPPPGGWPGAPGTSGGPVLPPKPRRVSRRAVVLGGGAAVLAAAAGISFLSHGSSPSSGSSASGTVPVTFAYSTEKAAWLQPIVNAFNQRGQKLNGSSKVITVHLTDLGSVDGQSQILSGQLKPVAWSPGSDLEINRLNYQWQQAHGGASIISSTEQFQPRSLVKSPLVIAAWQQRAQVLLNSYKVPTLDWDTLFSALRVNNWTDVGGQAGWGPVKFGQTLPTQSNSGLLTITLLAYHYFKEERSLTTTQVNDPDYWNYLGVFEGAVNAFGLSSGTYLKNGVIDGGGPAQADVIAIYENLVLTLQTQAQSQQHQPLLMYYPSVNMVSNHPFAVLQGDWVTDEQKQAALQFRDFLLDAPQQRLALSSGFRPSNSAIALNDSAVPNNPFTDLTSLFPHRQPDPLQSLAQPPAGEVVDALLNDWHQKYPTPPTTDG